MLDDPDRSDAPLLPTTWLVVALGVLVACGLLQQAALPPNGDASWYVYMAERVLDGARPYEDVVDTNPPLVVLLDMGVVALARGLGLDPLATFRAVTLLAIGLSLALSWRLGRGLPTGLRQASLLAWTYLLLISIGGSLGQREHLLMILVLPYAFGAIAESGGAAVPLGLGLATGLMAGVGFALKPFFVPAAVAVEAALAWRRGPRVWRRPQVLAMLAVWGAYAVVLATWGVRYLDVARRFAPLYPHHLPTGPVLLTGSWRLAVVAASVALGWATARRRCPAWAEVFGLLAAALTAAVYLTGKGWRYHWYPAMSIATALLAGSAASVALSNPMARRWGRSVARLAVLLLVPGASALSYVDATSDGWRDERAVALVRSVAGGGRPVLVLSGWVHRSFPMINETGASWGMRHPMLWQIGAFYADGSWSPGRYHPLAAMPEAERRFVGEVAEDFARTRPVLLLVDDDPPRPDLEGFDYLDYLARDPRFARTLADYEFVTATPWFRVFRRAVGSEWAVGSGQ